MTAAITLWLGLVLAIGAVTWFGTRRQAVVFTIISIATGFLAPLPLGHPSYGTPTMPATVLGAKIDKDVAIYVLLDGTEPRYYRLPYSEAAASQLQSALDGTADGEGGVAMEMGADGSPGFSETAPPPEPEKQTERAMIGG